MGKARRNREAKRNPELDARARRQRVIGAGIVIVLAVAIVAVAVAVRPQPEAPRPIAPDEAAAVPTGVFESDGAVPYGWTDGTYNPDLPTLALWEDFQCPGCGGLENLMGSEFAAIADEGLANVVYRPTAFLDLNLRTDASLRAGAAWGCAIDAGKGLEYHTTVFANQPEQEGQGWTNQQLLDFGKDAGIEGAEYDTFATCVQNSTYDGWIGNSTNEFFTDEIPGTPDVRLNGVPLGSEVFADPVALRAEIAKVAGGSPVDEGVEDPVSVPSPTQ